MAASRGIPRLGTLAVVAFGALTWVERRHALRQRKEDKTSHLTRNLAVAGLGALTLQAAERPVTVPVARFVARRRLGLLQHLPPRLRLSAWAQAALGVLLLDYSLYLWHMLEHRTPALWRFHAVHHADLDLDASTALRFHFGELAASVPWRAGSILLLGITPDVLALYQQLLMLSIMFHHSNVRIPERFERWFALLIMTPRLHGIHHSVVEDQINSNWSSGLTLWDRLHRTLRNDVPQPGITIGLSEHQDPSEVTLPRILVMPFAGA